MHVNIWEIIVLIGIAQGFVFSFTLLTNKLFKHDKANKFLSCSLLLLSITGVAEFILVHHIHEQSMILAFVAADMPWLVIFYVPMFVFFLKSGNHAISSSKKLWWLASPFAIFLTLNILVPNLSIFFQHYFSMAYIVLLCAGSFLAIKLGHITTDEKNWLFRIWGFNLGILVVWVIADLIPDYIYNNFNGELTYPVWIAYTIFMFWLVFIGLLRLELSQDKSAIQKILTDSAYTIQLTHSPTSESDDNPLVSYFHQFETLMSNEKLYRNPDLSREDVASKIGISPSYLSKVINSSTDRNFTSLINSLRVSEVKKMLQDPAFNPYSIWAIGMEAGFKSKSSFFDVFKKETGITPNQYKMLTEES
ncbi:MAG: helix-turn-helix transcriptional regulator [Marinoscillum sp.]